MGETRSSRAATNRQKLIAEARTQFSERGYAFASMEEITAAAGLTRGALYHGFGGKRGLLAAVIAQIDSEMAAKLEIVRTRSTSPWIGLVEEGIAYIEMALDPEYQRIMLLDGPAVLGDPSTWPGEQACLEVTIATMRKLKKDRVLGQVDVEASARLFNGAALTAALWIASSERPMEALPRAIEAFRAMANGLLEGG